MPDIGLILEGITSLEDNGGVATWAKNLIQSLPKRTFALMSFVNPSYPLSFPIKYPNILYQVNINAPEYPLDEKVLNETIKLENIPKCRLYHASSTGCASLLGMAAAEKYDVPFLLTEHAIYWKELQYSHELECGIRMEPIYSENLHRIAQAAYCKANQITSPVNFIRNQQIEDGADPKKTAVIPNGISSVKQKKKINWDIHTIGFVGRITRIKNLSLFLQIAEKLSCLNHDLHFKIIGPIVDPFYYTFLQNWIREHSLLNKIEFTGPLDVADWSKAIDCLMLTSQIETQPYVILEAFSNQIPVIAPSVGGIPETIEKAGFIFSPFLPIDEIAKEIACFLLKPCLIRKYAEYGWKLVQGKYHIDQMKKNFNKLYHSYLDTNVSR